MTIEDIERAERKIKEIKQEIKKTEEELSAAESKRRQSQNDRNMGLILMNNSTIKTYGTYKFVTALGEEGKYSTRISKFKSKLTNLKWELGKAERELREIEAQYAYEQRPEAKLIVEDEGIFIEGDESRRDIVKPLAEKVIDYIKDYESYAETPEVVEYFSLKQVLDESVRRSDLPEATEENLDEIKTAQIRTSFAFKYVVIDGKILVDKDFATQEIQKFSKSIEAYNENIAHREGLKDEFKPTFIGRLFKSVGKKQKIKNDAQIDDAIKELRSYRECREIGLRDFEEYKAKYITPALESIELLDGIAKLAENNPNVQRYVNEGESAKGHIDNKTILKTFKADADAIILGEIRGYLDSRGLKLSKENIFEAICQSKTYRWLAEQVKASGFIPSQNQPTGTQPGE